MLVSITNKMLMVQKYSFSVCQSRLQTDEYSNAIYNKNNNNTTTTATTTASTTDAATTTSTTESHKSVGNTWEKMYGENFMWIFNI